MPPKSAPAVADSTAERVLLGELHLLQSAQLAQRSKGPATWATAVAQLTQHCTELEAVVHKLHAVQHEQAKRDKQEAASNSKADAASAPTGTADSSAASALSGLSLSSSESASNLSALAAWLQKEAPECEYGRSWEFDPEASEAEGTGVRAVRALEKNEQFMRIPRKVMMTSDGMAASNPVGKHLTATDDFLCKQNPSLLLACALLFEKAKGDESYWASYIRCLPRKFNLPLLWTTEQVRTFLQVSPTVYEVLSLQRAHVKHYMHLHESLSKAGLIHKRAGKHPSSRIFRFSWADFQWAVCVLMSRQNQIPLPKKLHEQRMRERANAGPAAAGMPPSPTTSVALIPGWDSCNHRGNGAIATFFNIDTQTSDSHTMESVAVGAPIYLFYGARRNAHLMAFAGFVDGNHQSDQMMFELSMDGIPWSRALPLTGNELPPAAAPAAGAAASASSASSSSVPISLVATSSDPLLKIKLMLLRKVGMNGSGFMIKLPLGDRVVASEEGFESRFNKGAESSAATAEEIKAAEESGDPDAVARLLSQKQEAAQAARASFRALMHFLRVSCLTSKEAASLALKHKPSPLSGASPLQPSYSMLPSLYPEHDLEAITFLHDALVAALHSYPTTLEHDEAELVRDETKRAAEEHELPEDEMHHHTAPSTVRRRHRLGIEMRRSEKKLLLAAIAKTRTWQEEEHAKVEKAASSANKAAAPTS